MNVNMGRFSIRGGVHILKNCAADVINAEISLFAPPDELERLKSVCFQVQRRLMTGQPGERMRAYYKHRNSTVKHIRT